MGKDIASGINMHYKM